MGLTGAQVTKPRKTRWLTRAMDSGVHGIELDVYGIDGERFVFHDRATSSALPQRPAA